MPKRSFKRSNWPLFVAIMFLWFLAMGCASSNQSSETEAPKAVLTARQTELNLQSFDMVFETIRDKHYDETLQGVDWVAAGAELRPQVAEATTMNEARIPMMELIQRLKQSHFVIYPADVYDDVSTDGNQESANSNSTRTYSHSGIAGASGLELRVLQGQILVSKVLENSTAAAMGVKPGWEVLAIDSVDLAQKVEKISQVLEGQPVLGLMLSRSMEARLAGEMGDRILVLFRDENNAKVGVDLKLGLARGKSFAMGNLPAVHVWTESEVLPGDIGYFHFNYFLDVMTVMGEFNQAMTSFQEYPGVIIDLRGNPGGLGAMAMGMAGWFVDERGLRLGTMIMRTGEMNFVINARANGYDGKVALLIDELSASTSEILAGGMKDLKLARVFGMNTAGAALPSNIEKLPNGDGFQYAIANYISEGGEVLEGVGVAPDVEIIPTRESLLLEGDPILNAAKIWLLETETTED